MESTVRNAAIAVLAILLIGIGSIVFILYQQHIEGKEKLRTIQDELTETHEKVTLLNEERDELLEEAIELLQQQERASTSLLQRRLRIGYPRAARLMNQLEEEGIVGPPESGGRWREVLILQEDEDMEDEWEL